ncbi:MAG: hypothetical protein ACR2PT_08325 [Endozoicomonas sp.]
MLFFIRVTMALVLFLMSFQASADSGVTDLQPVSRENSSVVYPQYSDPDGESPLSDHCPAIWVSVQSGPEATPDPSSLQVLGQLPPVASCASFLQAGWKVVFTAFVPLAALWVSIYVSDYQLVSLAMATGIFLLSTWEGLAISAISATTVAGLALSYHHGMFPYLPSVPKLVWFTAKAAGKMIARVIQAAKFLVPWGCVACLEITEVLLWLVVWGGLICQEILKVVLWMSTQLRARYQKTG